MKNKHILIVITVFLILCSISSCKLFGKKALIGRISEDGKKYIAYNDLFAINSTKFNKTDATISEMEIADELDEKGYRFICKKFGQIIDEFFLFRDHTDYGQFKALAQKKVNNIGDLSEISYSNISEIDNFTLYYLDYNIVGISPYNISDKEYNSTLSFLFCFNDSIQFVLSRFIYSDHSFGDKVKHERGGRYVEKRLKFTLLNNLELNEKLFKEGVPEPLTEEELKALGKRKLEKTIFRKRELGFEPPKIN